MTAGQGGNGLDEEIDSAMMVTIWLRLLVLGGGAGVNLCAGACDAKTNATLWGARLRFGCGLRIPNAFTEEFIFVIYKRLYLIHLQGILSAK